MRSIAVEPIRHHTPTSMTTIESHSLSHLRSNRLILVSASFLSLIQFVSGASQICMGANCLGTSPTFTQVFDQYFESEIGYYYPPALFHFFIALIAILVAVWLAFFVIQLRQVWTLHEALGRERVVRAPGVWASSRHSVTRDVVARWIAPHEAPIVPVGVTKIPILVHFPMASAKLSVNAMKPIEGPNSEYTLRLTLSTVASHSCLIEVWFGVPLKTVSLFLSDYVKFTQRHTLKEGTRGANKPPRKTSPSAAVGDKAASPLMGGRSGARQTNGHPPASTEAFVSPSPVRPAAAGSIELADLARRGGGGGSAGSPRVAKSSRVMPELQIDTEAPLPGTAPSPHTSPSHVTAESESKHLSHLSLREKDRGSLSQLGSLRGGGGVNSGRLATALSSGVSSSPSIGVGVGGNSSSSSSPPLPAPSVSGPTPPLTQLRPEEGSKLFLPSEALFTLTPTIYPPGSKQTVHINFPQAWLRETLNDPAKCPILIFLSGIDESSAVSLNGLSTNGGELTIIQFSPAVSTSSPGLARPPGPSALPAPAIQAQVNAPTEQDVEEGKEEDEEQKREEQPLSPSTGTTTSPNANGMQDAITTRIKLDRQLIVVNNETYEMEELYGVDESDSECIICLTDLRDVILLPCRHVCVCQGCFKSITKCPICRARIHSHMSFKEETTHTADTEKKPE